MLNEDITDDKRKQLESFYKKASVASEKNNYDDLDDNNENNLIRNIFKLNEKSVEDVMVPRAEIIAIEKKQNMKDILSIINMESHNIIGRIK